MNTDTHHNNKPVAPEILQKLPQSFRIWKEIEEKAELRAEKRLQEILAEKSK